RLHVVRPAYRAHAGGAVFERDEPEPAVRKPGDGDIAFGIANVAPRVAKVAEYRGARMLAILAFDAEAVGEKRIAPGGIDQKFGAPGLRCAVGETQRNER